MMKELTIPFDRLIHPDKEALAKRDAFLAGGDDDEEGEPQMQDFLTNFIGIFLTIGFAIGLVYGKQSEFIGYDVRNKEFEKGYKLGFRKGREKAEKDFVEKLKKL